MKDVLSTRINWIKQGEESLQQIVSTLREESLHKIVSGIYDPTEILKNMSEQDICLDCNLKELIDWEGNVMELFDQRDTVIAKDKCCPSAAKKDCL